MSEERRNISRARTILAAQIILHDGGSTVDCTVRNLSDTGARVKVEAPFTLPEHFKLHIPKSNILRSVEVKWRTISELGVQFLD